MHALSTTDQMSKITKSAISQKPVNPPPQKKLNCVTYVYTFLQIYGLKFKIPITTEIHQFVWHLGNLHLMAQQMVQQWYIQKSEIG